MLTLGLMLGTLLALGRCATVVQINTPPVFCRWGEKFWCMSPRTAAQCGQTEWCARKQMSLDIIEKSLAGVISEICDQLPPPFNKDCLDSVVQTTQRVTQQVDTTLVVRAISYCNGSTTALQLAHKPAGRLNGELCDLCKEAVACLDQFLIKNTTQEEIVLLLSEVCIILPDSIKQQCHQLVQQYAPLVFTILTWKLQPEQVCTALGLCQSAGKDKTNSLVKLSKVKTANGTGCTICDLLVSEAENLLSQNVSKVEIKSALDRLCKILPSEYAASCQLFVDQYTLQVIDFLLQNYSPTWVCAELGFCPSSNTGSAITKVKVTQVNNGPLCLVCELLITELENKLFQNASAAEIESALDKVCSFLPGDYQEVCDALVKQYTPLIVKMILQKLTPQELCAKLKLCSSSESSSAMTQVKVTQVSDGPVCSVCELLITELENRLSQNASVAEIEHVLGQVCRFLPGDYQAVCDVMVKQYTPLIVKMILQKLTPQKLCAEMKLCSSLKSTQMHSAGSKSLTFLSENEASGPVHPSASTKFCQPCQAMMNLVRPALSQPIYRDQQQAVLLHLCNQLSSGQDLCHLLVPAAFQHFLHQVAAPEFPGHFCRSLNLCHLSVVQTVTGPWSCSLCQLLAEELEHLIQQQLVIAQVETILTEMCSLIVPQGDLTQCVSMVTEFTPVLIKFLVKQVDPKVVCQTLELCTEPARM